MGVHEGQGQLSKAMKDLLSRWAETKGSWDDAMSEKFENTYLLPLQSTLRDAMGAMNHMAQVLSQIHRDCE